MKKHPFMDDGTGYCKYTEKSRKHGEIVCGWSEHQHIHIHKEIFKAAVCIDGWKFKIFEKHLTEAGCKFTKHPGLSKNTMTLTVETTDMGKLAEVIKKANNAARDSKLH